MTRRSAPGKLARVDEAHVAPLNAFVRTLRAGPPERVVPWFGPADDGVDAQVLVFMESPGPRTVAQGNRGICSEDNDDPTAEVLATTRRRGGLNRQDYMRWNVAPWPVLDAEGSWTAPRAADLVQARGPLGDLLDLLPDLRVVVCIGAAPLQGFMATVTTRSPTRVVPVLGVQHLRSATPVRGPRPSPGSRTR